MESNPELAIRYRISSLINFLHVSLGPGFYSSEDKKKDKKDL